MIAHESSFLSEHRHPRVSEIEARRRGVYGKLGSYFFEILGSVLLVVMPVYLVSSLVNFSVQKVYEAPTPRALPILRGTASGPPTRIAIAP